MRLHSEQDGHPQGERVVLLHGFAQTARCWGPIAEDLARDHHLVRIDAPGHGGSDAIRADLPHTGQLIAEAGGRAIYIGYSMGARMALHAALHAPRLVHRLVLVGGTPGIIDPTEREIRRLRDQAGADRLRADGVDAFLASWFDQPLFRDLPEDARFLDERRRNRAEGLATSLEMAGTGSQAPLWDRLGQLTMPLLVVAGEADQRYADIAHRTAEHIGPHAQVHVVPDAGHAAHLEQPAAFLRILRHWLAAD